MSINYMILDDEPIAHDIILRFAKELTHLQFQKSCYNPLEALSYLSNHSVDLLFLDINMPHMKGLEFLSTLTNKPKVILTTAYEEYALKGYEFNVVDYLLKPFSLERFASAIAKLGVAEIARNHSASDDDLKLDTIFLKSDKKHYQVKIDDILWVEGLGSYLKVFTVSGTIICHEKISDFQALFPERLIRVHKSYIVALNKIKSIEGNRIFLSNHSIPIGQTYKLKLMEYTRK